MPNKYEYLYILQGNYGRGWEDLTAEPATREGHKAIKATEHDYLVNEGHSYRTIHRRVKL